MSIGLNLRRARKAAPSPKPPDAKTAVDDARKSVEDAASIGGTLWLSYLFTLFYIGLAAGGVTHRDLLLENPVRLPFLNVELPLVAFFALSPILFVIVHAYALTHFVLLAGKIGAFDAAMQGQDGAAGDIRRRLPSNIFVQFLAGPGDIREGGLGFLLKAIAWISLVVAPVLLLLFSQAQFLPYHLEWVTCVQRLAVFADVILLWALWPAVIDGRSALLWPQFRPHPVTTSVAMLISAVPFALAFFVATFPGGFLGDWNRDNRWIPPTAVTVWLGAVKDGQPSATSLHHLLFAGEIDKATRQRVSPFSNSLVLTGFDLLQAIEIDDEKKLDWQKTILSLRGRHLESAVFDFADLRKTDFTGAILTESSLNSARLDGSIFDDSQMERALLGHASLQNASYIHTNLQHALLAQANLRGATLSSPNFQEARLDGADFRGASFTYGTFTCTTLSSSSFQGASLFEPDFRGSDLSGANFRGAYILGADFRDTSLDGAQMQAAMLNKVNLVQASLIETQFQGARLYSPNLQTASLGGAVLNGAMINNPDIWKSDVTGIVWNDAIITFPNAESVDACAGNASHAYCAPTPIQCDASKIVKKHIFRADGASLYPDATTEFGNTGAAEWKWIANSPPSREEFENAVREIWSQIGCMAEGAPFVVQTFLRRLNGDGIHSTPFSEMSGAPAYIANAFLTPRCAGAKGLSAPEIEQLKALAENARATMGKTHSTLQ